MSVTVKTAEASQDRARPPRRRRASGCSPSTPSPSPPTAPRSLGMGCALELTPGRFGNAPERFPLNQPQRQLQIHNRQVAVDSLEVPVPVDPVAQAVLEVACSQPVRSTSGATTTVLAVWKPPDRPARADATVRPVATARPWDKEQSRSRRGCQRLFQGLRSDRRNAFRDPVGIRPQDVFHGLIQPSPVLGGKPAVVDCRAVSHLYLGLGPPAPTSRAPTASPPRLSPCCAQRALDHPLRGLEWPFAARCSAMSSNVTCTV